MSPKYNPQDLPMIDEVHILYLGYEPSSFYPTLNTGFRSFSIPSTTRITDEQLTATTSLWRQLPVGETARCHTPRYGIRFLQSGQTLVEASICWRCNNIFILIGGETTSYGFDGEALVSRQLLEMMQQLSGRHVDEDET